MTHNEFIEEPPQGREMHFAGRHRHVECIEIPAHVSRHHLNKFNSLRLTPIREDAKGVQIRLPRVGIPNLPMKELLERKARRGSGLRDPG